MEKEVDELALCANRGRRVATGFVITTTEVNNSRRELLY
jgi:hypothetical protein